MSVLGRGITSSRIRVSLALFCALLAVALTLGLASAVRWIMWQDDGVAVCDATGYQLNSRIASDGSGGAVVAWSDSRSGQHNTYAQRLDSTGSKLWTADGVQLCFNGNVYDDLEIVSDGSGGAIVVWEDRTKFFPDFDLYIRRVDANGNTLWPANGLTLCVVVGRQRFNGIVPDGCGGAIVTWDDERGSLVTGRDIYAQRVCELDESYLPLVLKRYPS